MSAPLIGSAQAKGGVTLSEFAELLGFHGLLKRDLAKEIGVTPETVSRWKDEPPELVMMWLREKKQTQLLERELRRVRARLWLAKQ